MTNIKKKAFWKSSTLWINFGGVVAIILTIVLKSELVADKEIIAIITATLNILNRLRKVEKVDLSIK